MGRPKNKKCAPFTAVQDTVMHDPRFRQLSSSAKVVYWAMTAKVKTGFGPDRYSYEFAISYSELVKWNLTTATISKAIMELDLKGFIEMKKHGGLRGCNGVASTYTLSLRFKNLPKDDEKKTKATLISKVVPL